MSSPGSTARGTQVRSDDHEGAVLNLLHHVHHLPTGGHEVHHCGGDHTGSEYTVTHCPCGLHSIDTEYFRSYAHALNEHTVIIQFASRCPHGGWHAESGREV